jgi:hypothetical protein
MTNYYLNGTLLQEGVDFTLDGFTYPYSWLEGTTESLRASLNIFTEGDTNYDPKYYWSAELPKNLDDQLAVDQEGNPVYVRVLQGSGVDSEMVDTEERLVEKGLKTICTSEVKSNTNNLLKPTDYYIIRNEVESTEIPESVSTYRSEVITESDRVVTAIANVTTVEELIEVMGSITWPKA